MSLRINHNIASINGHRNLMKNQMSVQSSLEKLSSGLRINRAADDAAGLVISEQMRAQISGLNQAIDNSETAVSMVQTAEGALDEVNSLLTKARELTLHAANEGANDTNQLAADQAELDNVISSISRISNFTQFGTKKLLDGSLNGASNMDAAFQRVNVGNLANNTAVNNGTFAVNIAETTKSSTTALSGTAISGMFSTGQVNFDNMTSATKLTSGTTLSVTISGTGGGTFTVSATGAGTGQSTVGDMVDKLNTAITGNLTVSLATGGGLKIARTDVSDDVVNFSASFTFGGVADTTVAGQNGKFGTSFDDADLKMTNLFGSANSSGISASTTMKGAGQVRITMSTSTGGFYQKDIAYSDGTGLGDLLSGVRADLTANLGNGGVGTGTTFAIAATATGFTVTFDTNRETFSGATGTALSKMTLDLRFDNTNVPVGQNDVEQVVLGGLASGITSGLFNVASGSSLTSGTTLAANATFTLTVGTGVVTVTGNAGASLADIASGFETALGSSFQVVFMGSGTTPFSGSNIDVGQKVSGLYGTDIAANGAAFLIANTDGSNVTGVSLRIDSAILSGTDLDLAVASRQSGAVPDAILNLTGASITGAQSGVVTSVTSGIQSGTLTAGSYTQVTGDESINATLTSTANTGLSLTLTVNADNADSSVYTLDLANVTGNQGYEGVRLEMTASTIDAAMVSGGSFNFTVSNGADFQVGANAGQKVGLTIGSVAATELGRNVEGSGTITSLDDLVSTKKSALTAGMADEALKVIDAAIDEVTVMRGKLGAFQANTLETGLNSLRVSSENLTAAESTIRDVDFAKESANFTRNNILVQSATAMLAQANQLPQNVLQLLG